MRYRPFEPLRRDLSVLVLGTVLYRGAAPDQPLDLLDAWRELGGTVLDTAREYGAAEGTIARWRRLRGRGDEVVMTKGAHQDDVRRRVTPQDITDDLLESLETLEVDRIDVYLLHRDDPTQPVGPIVEALNEHREAGRIGVFGASNWTPERLAEANAYAAANELEGFACSSPALSLATQNEPPWPECVAASDPASRAWYAESGMPIFAWSSQAGGFFAGVDGPDIRRVYDNPDNRERLRRATELAERQGCRAHHVALAWVLRQPFPTFALIGPRTVPELEDCLTALDVELTDAEWRWLDLDDAMD